MIVREGLRNEVDFQYDWVVIGEQSREAVAGGEMREITGQEDVQDIGAVVPVARKMGVALRFRN